MPLNLNKITQDPSTPNHPSCRYSSGRRRWWWAAAETVAAAGVVGGGWVLGNFVYVQGHLCP